MNRSQGNDGAEQQRVGQSNLWNLGAENGLMITQVIPFRDLKVVLKVLCDGQVLQGSLRRLRVREQVA